MLGEAISGIKEIIIEYHKTEGIIVVRGGFAGTGWDDYIFRAAVASLA